VIDLHTHILPGVDDGARTPAESIELARCAVADGTRIVAATPHVRDDYPTDAPTMEGLVRELRRALKEANVGLEVLPGAEIALERVRRLRPEAIRRFGLAGSDRYVLVEFPYAGWPLDLGMVILDLRAQGVTPVLAHPERNREVQAQPDRLRPFVEAGARVQVTAASVDGRLGRGAARAATDLLDLRLVHLLASDAHSASVREVGLSAALDVLGDSPLGRWLVVDAPGAVLAGEALPAEAPRFQRRRRFRLPRLGS
jgi:protein-tyrosine phosphatase